MPVLYRIIRWIGVAGLVLIAIFYVILFQPYKIVPPLGRGLSPEFRVAEGEFKDRIRDAFPIGTDEGRIEKLLGREGFTITSLIEDGVTWHMASFHKAYFVCELEWLIRWRAEQDKVASIKASYGATCL